jgi:hypothetical protein
MALGGYCFLDFHVLDVRVFILSGELSLFGRNLAVLDKLVCET